MSLGALKLCPMGVLLNPSHSESALPAERDGRVLFLSMCPPSAPPPQRRAKVRAMRQRRTRISTRDTHDMPKKRPHIPPVVATI